MNIVGMTEETIVERIMEIANQAHLRLSSDTVDLVRQVCEALRALPLPSDVELDQEAVGIWAKEFEASSYSATLHPLQIRGNCIDVDCQNLTNGIDLSAGRYRLTLILMKIEAHEKK